MDQRTPAPRGAVNNSLFQDVLDFHKKFGLEYNGPPRELPDDLGLFRTKFLGEELAEYISPYKTDHIELEFLIERMVRRMKGLEKQGLDKKLDALVDIVYVALGAAVLHGFDFDEAWRRVQAANMAKVRAERADQSARGSTFDVVKPPGWQPADLSDLVQPGPGPDPRMIL